jgi:hypothetical protein
MGCHQTDADEQPRVVQFAAIKYFVVRSQGIATFELLPVSS